jgi:hypothetical protein
MDRDLVARNFVRTSVVDPSLCIFLGLAIAAASQTAPPAASTPPDQKYSIEAKVTNRQTSELVKKVNEQGFAATSQSDGAFRFEGLGTTLVLQPCQRLTGINWALIPQGVIRGKVLDDDSDPMGQVSVRLLYRNWIRAKEHYFPSGQTGANQQREFRISNLSPRQVLSGVQQRQKHDVRRGGSHIGQTRYAACAHVLSLGARPARCDSY